MNACIMHHRVWISVPYVFWYSVHSYSLLGNLQWGFQKMVTKMFICNMSYSVKKKKRNLFIPLPLECAKNWNSEILITRPRVQDEQFDPILTEIEACGIVIMHCRLDLIIVGALLPRFYYTGWVKKSAIVTRAPFCEILNSFWKLTMLTGWYKYYINRLHV